MAVFAASPALSSLLSGVLATSPGLRVREFVERTAFSTYLRLAPVDLLVADFDHPDEPADLLAREARRHCPDVAVIGLARHIDRSTRMTCSRAGIDEVIVKPMSPRYLLERVVSRLRPSPEFSLSAPLPQPLRPSVFPFGSNVVALDTYRRARSLH